MKIKILVLCGFLFSMVLLNAQTDFRPGYVIETPGDTLFGSLDYRGDILMSSFCTFKDEAGVIKEYSPNDIVAFRFVDSKYYVSREIDKQTMFLEYLIKGQVNIYYMRDDAGDHYYIDKEGMKLTKIPYEEGARFVDGNQVYYESTKHVGFLTVYMQDAPELQSQIQSFGKPDHDNLIKLAEDYHYAVCDGEKCITFEKKVPSVRVSFTPIFGVTKYKGEDTFANEFGSYVYFWAPRTSEKLFFKTGLSYHQTSYGGDDLKIFRIPIQFQYIYRAHKIQPNISGGVNLLGVTFVDSDKSDVSHTLSLNAGVNYSFSNSISLCASFNTDYTPFGKVMLEENASFQLVSYSFVVGLRFDL